MLKTANFKGRISLSEIRPRIEQLRKTSPGLVATLEKYSEEAHMGKCETPYTRDSIPHFADAVLQLNDLGVDSATLRR